ncbi:MAG: ZIP family metal transporter [Candidatus Bathyarchaeia archaeon]
MVLLSLIAGSATGIGGVIIIGVKKASERLVGFSMGFASGVMLLVSFISLLTESLKIVIFIDVAISFSAGAVLILILDLLLPHMEFFVKEKGFLESKLFPSIRWGREELRDRSRWVRTGLLIMIGISLHNLPEGIVVSAGYAHLPRLGLLMAIAVGFHNIPEGVATAIPLVTARMSKRGVAGLTLLSGLAEPLGALIGATLLLGTSPQVIGSALAFAAGVMTYITADELIPIAHEYGHKHSVSVGLLLGIIFTMFLTNAIGL